MGDIRDEEGSFPILSDLRAHGPYREFAKKLETFGQFVGVWDLLVEFYDDNGDRTYGEPGTWSFAWVLDGRAIQDVLVYPRETGTGPVRGIGTSLRFYNPARGAWQVIWLGAVTGVTVVLWGGPHGGTIRLEGPDPDGTLNRWEFTDIHAERFVWQGFESSDGGQTWLLRQRMTARRKH